MSIGVAVVGCGHMGAHHAAAIKNNPRCRLVALLDVIPERARALAERHGGQAFGSLPAEIEAVIVATPTSTHVEVAAPLLEQGIWCLVEKPLAPTAERARPLRHATLVAGHVERFNPAIACVSPLRPRRMVARRLAPRGARGLDASVVHDLMIHDLDLFLAWAQAPVRVKAARGDPKGALDQVWAEVVAGDFHGTFHASRCSPARVRSIDLTDARGETRLDLQNGVATGASAVSSTDSRDALGRQLDAFVDAVQGVARPCVGFSAGWAALQLADEIVETVLLSVSPAVAGSP